MNENEVSNFEERARQAFDASVDALDAHTRSQLTQARQRAIAELDRSRGAAGLLWRPATALAAVALVAVLVMRGPGSDQRAPAASDLSIDDIEVVAEGDDLDLAREDLEFYAFVANEVPNQTNGSG
jgi:hypothetical protein